NRFKLEIMTPNKHQPSNRLIDTYNQMMAAIRETFENADTSDLTLQKALNDAKDQAVHLGEVTMEEAHEISEYIKRDINDAAEYMMDSSAEFSDWLMLDIEVIERQIIDLFLSVADRTRIELEQFQNPPHDPNEYQTGEITGPGTLVCTQCGHNISFITTGEIEACPECKNTTFQRAQTAQK
ncbi:MAG: zinc ribbon-containing protein, partial [Gammaproteobacteria bacterium]|nr:zinc ribbon-containing protein [Gammaproteobacteria bacterium]